MTPNRPPHLWIFGTSVSIERPGYVQHLEDLAAAAGWKLVNLSVGDQCSIMGYLRVLQHLPNGAPGFAPGDCALWEYSLLDHFLADGFDAADICALRLQAWRELGARGVSVIALLMPPRDALDTRTSAEASVALQAQQYGIAVHDARAELAAVPDVVRYFRDDRHVLAECIALKELAASLWQKVQQAGVCQVSEGALRFEWLGAHALAARLGKPVELYSNSLLSTEALRLRADHGVALPASLRVVAAGVLSEHASGALWCGHPGCPPSSTRLPNDLSFSFLLRVAFVACQRAPLTRLVSAPDWSFQRGQSFGYGFAPCPASGDVLVFGVLIELMPQAKPSFWGALRRRFADVEL